MAEDWKPIDFNNIYYISNCGQVKNTKTDRILKPRIIKGYYTILLRDQNQLQKSFLIHRLVAKYFIPNPENKPTVNHIDRNRTNNNYNNLEWNTRLENCQHRSIGLNYKSNKNKPIYRLSKDEEILEKYNSIERQWIFSCN